MTEEQIIITCPNCENEILIDDTLYSKIEAKILATYEVKESELNRKYKELETAQKDIDRLIAKAIKEHVIEVENNTKAEIERLKSKERDLSAKLTDARAEQVLLMDEKRKLQDEKETFEIERRKQLEIDRALIKEEADKKAAETYKTILAQKEKTIADTIRMNEDLRRKLEQGSQQSQGEVAELHLEEELKRAFIRDIINPVPKGISGADIIQNVINNVGIDCGYIIWEVKNTKTWSESWVQKLKDDQRAIHADVAIIISSALPEGINAFSFYNGVWVCSVHLAIPLATIIRDKLEAISREKGLAVGKNEKMEVLYQYLTGVQFKQRIEAIIETFNSMKTELDKEKQYYMKKWAKMEKQIDRIMINTVGIYGDLDGMVNLPKIQSLELENDVYSDK